MDSSVSITEIFMYAYFNVVILQIYIYKHKLPCYVNCQHHVL